MKALPYFSLVVFACALNNAQAIQNNPPTTQQNQINSRQQQQQTKLNSEIQSQQIQQPHIHLEGEKIQSTNFPVNEAQCFPIHQLILTDFNENYESSPKLKPPSLFSWALRAVYAQQDFALPACIGKEGINVLLRRIQNRLIEMGFVTTRVVVEPQDLRTGTLVLTIIPGKVGQIQLQDQSAIPFATRGTL